MFSRNSNLFQYIKVGYKKFYKVKNKKFSLIHIDVDLYKPTFDSLSFFYPKLCKGGVILCDDL